MPCGRVLLDGRGERALDERRELAGAQRRRGLRRRAERAGTVDEHRHENRWRESKGRCGLRCVSLGAHDDRPGRPMAHRLRHRHERRTRLHVRDGNGQGPVPDVRPHGDVRGGRRRGGRPDDPLDLPDLRPGLQRQLHAVFPHARQRRAVGAARLRPLHPLRRQRMPRRHAAGRGCLRRGDADVRPPHEHGAVPDGEDDAAGHVPERGRARLHLPLQGCGGAGRRGARDRGPGGLLREHDGRLLGRQGDHGRSGHARLRRGDAPCAQPLQQPGDSKGTGRQPRRLRREDAAGRLRHRARRRRKRRLLGLDRLLGNGDDPSERDEHLYGCGAFS